MSYVLSQSPFFIVGCARSGTTLLRRLLNQHPEIAIPLESLFIIDYLRSTDKYELTFLKKLIINEPEIQEWGITPRPTDLNECESIAQVVDKLHILYAQSHKKFRWGQKTPRFVRHLELLRSHFPSAKFIHIIRDPRAVANSLIQSNVHYSNIYYAIQRWNRDVKSALTFESSYPECVFSIRYEALVTKPDQCLEGICQFLDINFDPEDFLGSFDLSEYSHFYSKIHANLSSPPNPEHVEKWKKKLSRDEISTVEYFCEPLMKQLGYDQLTSAKVPQKSYLFFMRLDRFQGLLKQVVYYLRYRRTYATYLIRRKYRLGLIGDFFWNINQ